MAQEGPAVLTESQNVIPTPEETAYATKRLREWSVKNSNLAPSEDLIRLFVAMARNNKAGDAGKEVRITPQRLDHLWKFRSKIVEKAEHDDKFWVQMKANIDEARMHKLKPYLVKPEILRKVPPSVLARYAAHVIIDRTCPKELVGVGASKVTLSLGLERELSTGASLGGALALPDSQPTSQVVQVTEASGQSHITPPQTGPVQTEPCPKAAGRNTEVGESIARRFMEAMDAGRISSANVNNPDYAEFWVRKFYATLGASLVAAQRHNPDLKAADYVLGQPQKITDFPRCVAFKLSKCKSYHELAKFVHHFVNNGATFPGLHKEEIQVLVDLSRHPLESEEELTLNLPFSTMERFLNCQLYRHFVTCSDEAKVKKVIGDTRQPDHIRYRDIQRVQKIVADMELRGKLDFGITIFGPMPEEVKIKFLMAAGNVARLKEWAPLDPRLVIQVLLQETQNFLHVHLDDYVKAAEILVKAPAALDVLPHPVVKLLLKDYVKMKAVEFPSRLAGVKDKLVFNLFVEASLYKLGLGGSRGDVVEDSDQEAVLDPYAEYRDQCGISNSIETGDIDNELKALVKILGRDSKKMIGEACMANVTKKVLQRCEEIAKGCPKKASCDDAPARTEPVTGGSESGAALGDSGNGHPVAKVASTTEVAGGHDVRKAQLAQGSVAGGVHGIDSKLVAGEVSAAPPALSDKLASEGKAEPCRKALEVGDIVIVNQKFLKYKGFEGKVLAVKSKQCRVRMLKGPTVGVWPDQEHDFDHDKLTIVPAVPQEAPKATPAGTEPAKRPEAGGDTPDEKAAKKIRLEQEQAEARQLYGDLTF